MARKRKHNAGPKRKVSASEERKNTPHSSGEELWMDAHAFERMRRVTKPPYGPKPILSKDRFLDLADIALGGMHTAKSKRKDTDK